ARSSSGRPRGRASAPSTSTRGAAPSWTAAAIRSRSASTRRASTRCPRTWRTRRARRWRWDGPSASTPPRAATSRPCSCARAPSSGCAARSTPPPRAPGHAEKPSTEGQTVVLTLDESIQHVAERELEKAVQETGSLSGVAVVMDPRTGEILALANRPTFNPNRFNAYPSSRWRNRAVTDAYEPGSMFKIITAAAGLEEKVVGADEWIDCGHGALEVAGIRINDHAVFDQLTFRDVLAKPSDVGWDRVAQRLGRDNFNRYLRQFGFGAATGVELPAQR